MLTPENFKTLVGYQPSKQEDDTSIVNPTALVFMLCPEFSTPEPDDWVSKIASMNIDEVYERLMQEDNPPMQSLSLTINKYPVVCNRTLDEILVEAWNELLQLPKFPWKIPSHPNNVVVNQIAFRSRRGVGNAKVGNVIVYRGKNEFDVLMVIVKHGGRYGLVKHPSFNKYGFVVDDGTKIQV